jgi:hypothetical protein
MSKVSFPPLTGVTVSEYFLGSSLAEVDEMITLILIGALILTSAKLVSAEHKTPVTTTIIAAKIRKLPKRFIVDALKYNNDDFLMYKFAWLAAMAASRHHTYNCATSRYVTLI